MQAEPNESPNVVEVTDQTFMRDVIEESNRRPVVVDFWAAWCQPCRMIGPVLERLADEHQGQFLLAKLDVDANPEASYAFRVQSIPAVKAFRDGQMVSEFVGAIPESSIRQFLQQVLPSDADQRAERAEELERMAEADPAKAKKLLSEAEQLYRQALEAQPNDRRAGVGLGRVLVHRGRAEEARDLLSAHRPDPEAERLLAAMDVSGWASPDGDSPLSRHERAAAEGRWADALEGFLQIVTSGGDDRDGARGAMLKVFSVLGEDDPLTVEYRRRLAAVLF
jgi:putative thioredoxin